VRREEVTRGCIPFLHVPLPHRHNPVVVVPTTNHVKVTVSVEEGGPPLLLEGRVDHAVARAVNTFLKHIRKELELPPIHVNLDIDTGGYVCTSFLYVLMTNAIIDLLSGGIDEELVSTMQLIDRRIGVDDSVTALRYYRFFNTAYIWRYGESPIGAPKTIVLTVDAVGGSERSLKRANPGFPLMDLITRLAGLNVIEGFNKLVNNDDVSDVVRLNNALWYAIYGVEVPRHDDLVIVKELEGYSIVRFKR